MTEALTLICQILGDCKAKILDEVVRKLFPWRKCSSQHEPVRPLPAVRDDDGDDDGDDYDTVTRWLTTWQDC